jgi:hypothetical protein
MIEDGGRISLVTGAGSGALATPKVNVYNFDLFGDARGTFPDVRAKLEPKRVVSFDGSGSTAAGVSVATGNPYAGSGGFSNVLVTSQSGDAAVAVFAIHQVMDHAEHGADVAASGIVRPHDYEPTAAREATRVDELNLGIPADVTTLSTPTGARLLIAPRDGGHITPWESERKILPKAGAPSSIVRGRPLRAVGRRVSGS